MGKNYLFFGLFDTSSNLIFSSKSLVLCRIDLILSQDWKCSLDAEFLDSNFAGGHGDRGWERGRVRVSDRGEGRERREDRGKKKSCFFRGRNPLKKIDQVIKRNVTMSIMIKLR